MSSSQRRNAKNQLSALQAHIDELKQNIGGSSQIYKSSLATVPQDYSSSELDRMRQSLANMMDMFMGELEALKKDLYIDFGETQKLIANDINQLRADLTQTDLRLNLVEKQRGKASPG